MNTLGPLSERIAVRELLLATALESAQVGVWNWDTKTNALLWDEVMLRLMGVEREGFRNRYEDFARVLHPEDLPIVESRITAALRGAPYHYTFRVRRGAAGTWNRITGKGGLAADGWMSGVCYEAEPGENRPHP